MQPKSLSDVPYPHNAVHYGNGYFGSQGTRQQENSHKKQQEVPSAKEVSQGRVWELSRSPNTGREDQPQGTKSKMLTSIRLRLKAKITEP